jgi:hypothetical protein
MPSVKPSATASSLRADEYGSLAVTGPVARGRRQARALDLHPAVIDAAGYAVGAVASR